VTPVEPVPGATARFVIHEHYATNHHFDLRLEGAGVLWSWALPKGMPADPTRNRLAVRVDDHDLDHIDAVDPTPVASRGAPGGAIVKSIWDTGSYTVVRAEPGKVVFDLIGKRGERRYALIHTGEAQWLLHRMERPNIE
jgi:bifunctional non-homologous end joining protein LigD